MFSPPPPDRSPVVEVLDVKEPRPEASSGLAALDPGDAPSRSQFTCDFPTARGPAEYIAARQYTAKVYAGLPVHAFFLNRSTS